MVRYCAAELGAGAHRTERERERERLLFWLIIISRTAWRDPGDKESAK